MSTEVPRPSDGLADRLDRRLTARPVLTFPEGWTLSGSWQRAQTARSRVSSYNAAEWNVVLGHPGSNQPGGFHRVLFAVESGDVLADCNCRSYEYRDWCAHVAHLWWLWATGYLVVTDLNDGTQYGTPPEWVTVREGQR
ncbi:SWIM zinc finger family protein [Halobacteriales archaeon Cl-PHB]